MAPLARRVLLVALSVLGAVAAPAVPAGSVDAVGAVGTDGRQTPAPAPVVAPVPGPPSSDTSSTATGDPGEHAALPPGPAISGTASSVAEPTGTAPSVTGRVTWLPCRNGDIAPDALGSAGCARVAVPLDHDRPDGATIGLALLRWPAAEPDRRLGALFLNPGGPGGSGVALARNAPALVDTEVLARYDLIGFDPRGVGASDGLSCGVADRLLAPAEPPVDPLAAQEAYGAALAAACDRERPGLLATLDTATTARDLDVVRDAIGEEQLHYLGYSYGTALGATYARLFPGRTGRMVLDGPADPAVAYVDWVAAQLVSFEAVLERFLGACETTARCPLAGKAHATWSTLLERAADEGLAVPGEAPMGRGELLEATVDLLYLGTAHHELLAGALANAAAGDAAGLAAHSRRRSGLSAAAYYGTVCGDEPTRPAAAAVAARIEQLRVEAPTFAPQLREVLTCRGLDRTAAAPTSPPATAPTPPPDTPAADAPAAVPAEAAVPRPPGPPATGASTQPAPGALLVATRHDPATPYDGALALQRSLAGSSLLTWDAVGHTVVGHGEVCVEAVVRAYLLSGAQPAPGTTCRPVEPVGVKLRLGGASADPPTGEAPVPGPGTGTGTPVPGGRVDVVLPGSPAEGVLLPGDVVRSVDGRAVTRPMQLDEAASAGGGRVSVSFERPGDPAGVRNVVLRADPVPYWLP